MRWNQFDYIEQNNDSIDGNWQIKRQTSSLNVTLFKRQMRFAMSPHQSILFQPKSLLKHQITYMRLYTHTNSIVQSKQITATKEGYNAEYAQVDRLIAKCHDFYPKKRTIYFVVRSIGPTLTWSYSVCLLAQPAPQMCLPKCSFWVKKKHRWAQIRRSYGSIYLVRLNVATCFCWHQFNFKENYVSTKVNISGIIAAPLQKW